MPVWSFGCVPLYISNFRTCPIWSFGLVPYAGLKFWTCPIWSFGLVPSEVTDLSNLKFRTCPIWIYRLVQSEVSDLSHLKLQTCPIWSFGPVPYVFLSLGLAYLKFGTFPICRSVFPRSAVDSRDTLWPVLVYSRAILGMMNDQTYWSICQLATIWKYYRQSTCRLLSPGYLVMSLISWQTMSTWIDWPHIDTWTEIVFLQLFLTWVRKMVHFIIENMSKGIIIKMSFCFFIIVNELVYK